MATRSHNQGQKARFTKYKTAIQSKPVQSTTQAPANDPSNKATSYLPTEVLEEIASYCVHDHGSRGKELITDYYTLASLCRASRHFAKCFTPHLYRRIIFRTCPGQQQSRHRALIETLIFSPKLGNFIQEIDVGSNFYGPGFVGLYFDSVYDWIAHLYSPNFADYFSSVIDDSRHAPESALAVLIVLAPQLRKLSWPVQMKNSPVAAVFAWAQQYACPRAVKSKDTRLLAKLETLSYNNGETFSGQLQPLALMSSTLQNLTITGLKYRTRHDLSTGDLLHHAESTWCTLSCPLPTHRLPNLRSLTITNTRLTASTLTTLLANAPTLESLTLRNIVFVFISQQSTHPLLSAGSLGIILRTYTARTLKSLTITHDHDWKFNEKHAADTLQHVGAIGPLTDFIHLTHIRINPEMLLGWQNLSVTPPPPPEDYPFATLHAALPTASLENVCFDVSSRMVEGDHLGFEDLGAELREGFLHEIAGLMGAEERRGKLKSVYFSDNIFGKAPSDAWVNRLAGLEGWGPDDVDNKAEEEAGGGEKNSSEDKKGRRREGGCFTDQKLPMVFYPRYDHGRIVNGYMRFRREEVVVGKETDEMEKCVDPKELCEEVREWLYPDFEGDLGVKVYSRELAEEIRRKNPEETRAAFITLCTVGWSGTRLWELNVKESGKVIADTWVYGSGFLLCLLAIRMFRTFVLRNGFS